MVEKNILEKGKDIKLKIWKKINGRRCKTCTGERKGFRGEVYSLQKGIKGGTKAISELEAKHHPPSFIS